MSFIDQVQKELQQEAYIYKQICKELKKIPQGTLSVNEVTGNKYFTAKLPDRILKLGNIDGKGNTPKSRRLVSELTARHCIEKMKSSIETNAELLTALKKGYMPFDPNLLIPGFPKAYKEITEGIFNHTGYVNYNEWCNDKLTDDFRNEGRVHRTASGIMVRSRVEVAIADNYTMRGDKFIYEKKLILPDGTVLHPDFTILLSGTGKVLYHDHVTMLSNPDYLRSYLWKEQKLIEFGIYPNRDYIITTEEPDGGIDMEKLNRLLDCFLL